jgi:hypothetical protein
MAYKDLETNRTYARDYYHAHKDKARESAQERRRRAAEFIDAVKSGPCTDCKQTFPPCVMDFDHIRGTKVADISSMRGSSIERIAAEIAKCELVCANCHRIRTFNRMTKRIPAKSVSVGWQLYERR